MRKRRLAMGWPLLVALFASASIVSGEAGSPDVPAIIVERDRLFWKSYNECDLKSMGDFFSEDVEFYHDRGGITLGAANLVGSVRDNLCSNPEYRLRREAVEGTVQVFPLTKQGAVYGAVLSGEHLFYILDKGKPERADGRARFTHLWLLKDGAWKMSRVLSYDHRPVERPR